MKLTDPISLAAEKAHNLERRSERILKRNRQSGYRIAALMAALYGSKAPNLNRPYRYWSKKDRMLYSKVNRILRKLVSKGKVGVKRKGRFKVYHWKK